MGYIKQQRAARVGHVHAERSRQAQPDIILRQQQMPNAGVVLRLMLPEPKELRRGEAGQRLIACEAAELGFADGRLDVGALLRGALIAPEQRRPDNLLRLVEEDRPVHLAGEANTCDTRGFDASGR
ncbi:hypothetical protein J2736_000098 [Paenibacillus qinlingensis]|uniref:Uncharacterized protein n=1 Tax=Paenibacillus qinlingensis TaxID=1837343 RepID=A0ABU1NN72_9BACL|nr:hypothetical protein [Paenibacillus qinlingensis]